MKVRELMTASPDVVTPGDTVIVAAREMKKADVGAIGRWSPSGRRTRRSISWN